MRYEYKVVHELTNHMKTFEDKINDLINDNWSLLGGPITRITGSGDGRIYQALTRVVKEDKT